MKHQKGQVLPLGLALLVFGMLGAYVLFNTGQVATDKMKLANTADAAAYSGTLWQARALNFQSYTNRAMVANQVSIAQAVSLQSWVAYGAVASENIATVIKPVPVFNIVAEGLQRGLQAVENTVSPITNAMVSVVDAVNQGLSLSQEAMFVSTFVATPDVIRSVVNETDSRFDINTGFSGIGLANNLQNWRSFTEGFAEDDLAAMDERVQMINDSRDRFSQTRNWKFFDFWFYSTPLTRHQIRREGTTRLTRVDSPDGIEWEWKAKDTMSLHTRLWHWKGTKRYELPIGWAEAFANSANSARTIEPGACTTVQQMVHRECARFLGMNRHSEYLADLGMRSVQGQQTLIAMRNYTGVQAYRSLSRATISGQSPTISLKVEVALPTDAIKDSDEHGARGHFAVPVQAPGSRLSSVSVAEVFYKRPDEDMPGRANRPLEIANGYNPYWGSRLSPVSSADRLLAFSLRGESDSNNAPGSGREGLSGGSSDLADYDEDAGSRAGGSTAENSTAENTGSGATETAEAQAGSLVASTTGSVQDFETVAAAQMSGELNQLQDDIEDELVSVLRDEVGNMLAGAVSSRYGGSAQTLDELGDELEQVATDQLNDLVSTEAIQPFVDAVNEATNIATGLVDEFRAIRQTIVNDFQQSFESLSADLALEVASIERRLEEHRADLLDSELAQSAELAIASLNTELATAQEDFKDTLAQELMDLVNESSDVYVMQLDEANYLVDEFLRAELDEIELPWAEQVEEDDTDD